MRKNKKPDETTLINERLFDFLELTANSTGNKPLVQLFSNKELVVEGCLGLLSFDENTILLSTTIGKLKIDGRSLDLKNLSKSMVLIKGFILSVNYES
ncbi:MAG: YabP/YqfC family sporulation protein [Eubacteriales bacterium]